MRNAQASDPGGGALQALSRHVLQKMPDKHPRSHRPKPFLSSNVWAKMLNDVSSCLHLRPHLPIPVCYPPLILSTPSYFILASSSLLLSSSLHRASA